MNSSPFRVGLSVGFGGFCGIIGTSYFFYFPHRVDWGRAATIGIVMFLTLWLVLALKNKTKGHVKA